MSRAGVRPGLALLAAAVVWAAADTGFAQRPPPGSPVSTWRPVNTEPPAISGTVVDATTGTPLAGAVVSLSQDGPSVQIRQAADAAGRFLFSNLSIMTTYAVTASKPGYLDGAFGRTSWLGRPREVMLTSSQWIADADITLTRESAISGRILDSEGDPLVGVHVTVLARAVIAGEPRLVIGSGTKTDDRGHYRIPTLAPGVYVVMVPTARASVPAATPIAERTRATPDLIIAARGGRPPSPHREAFVIGSAHLLFDRTQPPPLPARPDGHAQGYATTFYPDVRSVDAARAIALSAGEERNDVEIRLRPVPFFSISGSLDGPPTAIGNLRLFLMPRGSERLGLGHETATSLSGADGRFTFVGVPAGEYTILAGMAANGYSHRLRGLSLIDVTSLPSLGTAAYLSYLDTNRAVRMSSSQPRIEYSGRRTVGITGADVTGVVIPLQRSASIRGRLVQEGESVSASTYRRMVRAEPAGGDPMLGEPMTIAAGAGATLAFTLESVIPGDYLLRMPEGATVKSVIWNGRDYTDTPFTMAPGVDVSGVVMTTTAIGGAARVQGIVRDPQGAPTLDATVIVFPAEPARWQRYGLASPRIVSARVSRNAGGSGIFAFSSMPAGEYYLLAIAGPLPDTWRDPAFLQKAAGGATRVSLTWGTMTSQDLTAVPLGP